MDIALLIEILLKDNPSVYIKENEEYIFSLIPELKKSKGFDQNNPWHIYDVYEHILHVVDGVPNDIVLRMAALFHDVGKPYTYLKDEKGVGHFPKHWIKSKEIFLKFASIHNLDDELVEKISTLIYYHDLSLKIDDKELERLVNIIGVENMPLLFQLKRADLLAQSEKYHYILEDYNKAEDKVKKFML
ncbi:MAG: HD domain-containing protein [Bacilli bacterium]|nr:HD domain-containing protein [Bacilli bacterium]